MEVNLENLMTQLSERAGIEIFINRESQGHDFTIYDKAKSQEIGRLSRYDMNENGYTESLKLIMPYLGNRKEPTVLENRWGPVLEKAQGMLEKGDPERIFNWIETGLFITKNRHVIDLDGISAIEIQAHTVHMDSGAKLISVLETETLAEAWQEWRRK